MVFYILILFSLCLLGVIILRKYIFHAARHNNVKFRVKYIFIYIALRTRQVINRLKRNDKPEDKIPKQLDTKRPLSQNKLAFDAVYFIICTRSGIIISAGCERRHDNIAYGLFYIWVPDIGLLYNKEMPQTKLETTDRRINSFETTEFRFTPIEPMKHWEIYFEGKMKLHNSNKFVDVKLNADWIPSSENCYRLDSDINLKALARALATESWSAEYFKKLNSDKQLRYEQFGKANGELTIGNKNMAISNDSAYRDHNFGDVRDWSKIHHYVYFIILLENGTNMVLGIISHPDTFSRLVIGTINDHEHYVTVHDIKFEYDMKKEENHSRENYMYSFNTEYETYYVKITVMESHTHYKGFNSEAVLTQKFSRINVNGIQGYGMFEIYYNRDTFKIQ